MDQRGQLQEPGSAVLDQKIGDSGLVWSNHSHRSTQHRMEETEKNYCTDRSSRYQGWLERSMVSVVFVEPVEDGVQMLLHTRMLYVKI